MSRPYGLPAQTVADRRERRPSMKAHKPLPDLAVVLYFLREGQEVSPATLGELSGVSPNLLNDYEEGRKTLGRERLELLISFMNLPPETIDATLARLHANR